MSRPENIVRGIRVRMIFVSAGDATEGGLVRPVLRRHVVAGKTGPARVPGIDPDQTSSPPRKLILQEGEERPPSLGQEGAVQTSLLPDVPARVLPGAPGAFGHVPDLQLLDIHDGLGFADRSRGLVEKIQTHVRHPFVGARHMDLLLPVVATLRSLAVFPGELALLPEELLFSGLHRHDQLGSRVDPDTERCRGKRRHPELHGDLRSGSCYWLRRLPLGLDGDGPSSAFADNGGVPECSDDLPALPKPDPSDLGNKNPGEALLLCQPVPNRPVQELERPLLRMDRAKSQKAVFVARPPQRQEFCQITIGKERHSCIEASFLEGQRLVPNEPGASRMAGQEIFLFGSRNETEFERLNCFHARNHNWPHGKVNRIETWKTLRFQNARSLGLCHKISSRGVQ